MTQDEIIEMAQECNLIGMRPHLDGIYSEALIAFANLVSAKVLEQRTWQGLTDKAITQVIDSMPKNMKGFMIDWDLYEFAQTIEAKLKQKNGFAEEKNK